MKKGLLVFVALFALSALVYAQAGLAGKWTGEQQIRGTAQAITLDLKVSGEVLTGTMTTGTTPAVALSDGKIAADGKATFNISENRGGVALITSWNAEAMGDTLLLSRGNPGRGPAPAPLTLKRSK